MDFKKIYNYLSFKGTEETLRSFFLTLLTIQATAGIGLISVIVLLKKSVISDFRGLIIAALLLHGIAMAFEIGIIIKLEWFKRQTVMIKSRQPREIIESRWIDITLLVALFAFFGLVAFLVLVLGLL